MAEAYCQRCGHPWSFHIEFDSEMQCGAPGCLIDGCGPAPRPPRSPKADDPILRAVRPLLSVALAEAYHTVGRQPLGRGGAEFCPAWISSEHGERRLCLMPIGHEGPHGTAVTAWVTWSDEAVDRG